MTIEELEIENKLLKDIVEELQDKNKFLKVIEFVDNLHAGYFSGTYPYESQTTREKVDIGYSNAIHDFSNAIYDIERGVY